MHILKLIISHLRSNHLEHVHRINFVILIFFPILYAKKNFIPPTINSSSSPSSSSSSSFSNF